jgi:hypothetical protein
MSAIGGKADMATYSNFSKSGKSYAHSIHGRSHRALKSAIASSRVAE